jgi:hypothetical protein
VQPGDRIIVITYADYDEAELESYEPRVVHVDTDNRAVPEQVARALATQEQPGPIRYHEVDARVLDRELAQLDAELDQLG